MKARLIRTMNKRRRNKRERAEWAAAGRLVRMWFDEAASLSIDRYLAVKRVVGIDRTVLVYGGGTGGGKSAAYEAARERLSANLIAAPAASDMTRDLLLFGRAAATVTPMLMLSRVEAEAIWPSNPLSDWRDNLQTLSPEERRRMLEGDWSAPE